MGACRAHADAEVPNGSFFKRCLLQVCQRLHPMQFLKELLRGGQLAFKRTGLWIDADASSHVTPS